MWHFENAIVLVAAVCGNRFVSGIAQCQLLIAVTNAIADVMFVLLSLVHRFGVLVVNVGRSHGFSVSVVVQSGCKYTRRFESY